jgi:hypothetical protein
MKTFKGKFVKGNEPIGLSYTFNTEEEIIEKEKFLFNEYHDPIFVEEILDEVITTMTIKDKIFDIKTVTLRNEEDEKETRSC